MNIMHEILKLAADTALVVERAGPETKAERLEVCERCPFLNKKSRKCRVCGCYVDIKTGTIKNRNPEKLRNEFTHCPKGKWNDKELANQYRKIDGLKPLK